MEICGTWTVYAYRLDGRIHGILSAWCESEEVARREFARLDLGRRDVGRAELLHNLVVIEEKVLALLPVAVQPTGIFLGEGI